MSDQKAIEDMTPRERDAEIAIAKGETVCNDPNSDEFDMYPYYASPPLVWGLLKELTVKDYYIVNG